jgi:VWFA-related protein
LKLDKFFASVCLSLALGTAAYSQVPARTPAAAEGETILTEEIKLNAAAFDSEGDFVTDVRKEDLVIVEDGRLQQPGSVRRVPANVLIVLDTGGEMRGNLGATRAAAKNLVASLQATDNISVFQYGDKVEMLADWTTEKAPLLDVLDKKLAFGKRSVLNKVLGDSVDFFYKTPRENRHLILVTSGIDSFNDEAQRRSAVERLMASDINVHVISYAYLQKGSLASQKAIFNEGEQKPRRLPEEVVITLPDPKRPGKKQEVTWREMARMPRLGSVTLDRERLKRANAASKQIDAGVEFLSAISEDTSGLFLLPETLDEMTDKTAALAKIIDSQYVVAYTPKRALRGSPKGEIRQIEVRSKREGMQVESRRKLVVDAGP